MLRSPFLILFLFIILLSCKEKTAVPVVENSNKKAAKLYQQKAIKNLQNKEFNSAFYNLNKSKIIFESIKDSSNIAFNLIQMASIQQINGDYYGSKETLTEALPYVKDDPNYRTAIANYFGIAHKELYIYGDAVLYYKEAIKNAKNTLAKQAPLNNIAVVYIQQKKYDQAIHLLESILSSKIANKLLPTSKARIIDNLGYAYFKKGELVHSLTLMNKSLEIRKGAIDLYGGIESNLHLAEYHSKTNSKKSLQHAEQAYELSTNFNSIDERLKALSFLISSDLSSKNTYYAQKYILLNDSILKIRNNFKNKFAKIKYDSKKEKDENQKLRLEKAENLISLQEAEYLRVLFVSGIIILFLTIIYQIKSHRNRTRIVKLKTAYDTETRIAKDIHDELANDVFHAITFTQTQALTNENTKEALIQKLDHIYTRVRGISRENNAIDTGENYSKNVKEMLSTYNNDTTNVITTGLEKLNWDLIDEIKKVTIHRVLQELMVNMKKHSHASLVVLKFDSDTKTVFIDYVDNGKGVVKEKIIKNGLRNMENRIMAIKGTIIFDTEPEKGFKVKITLPK
jgi:signal transduction histidine kinase